MELAIMSLGIKLEGSHDGILIYHLLCMYAPFSSLRHYHVKNFLSQQMSAYKALTRTRDEGKGKSKHKQRVLVLSSRGITSRQRHLMNDITALLPHAKQDTKLDTKSQLFHLNEIAELYNCNNVLFFEARKHQDLYIWMSKAPNGPTIKLHVQNLHTLEELAFTGNALKGSRPIVSFDDTFDASPFSRLLKELFAHIFSVPQSSRHIKPFVDRVVSFTLADNHVWFRNYQIVERKDKGAEDDVELVEIGPRFVMTPICVLQGSFTGALIYENKEYVSPNVVRAQISKRHGQRYQQRTLQKNERGIRRENQVMEPDPLSEEVLFK